MVGGQRNTQFTHKNPIGSLILCVWYIKITKISNNRRTLGLLVECFFGLDKDFPLDRYD